MRFAGTTVIPNHSGEVHGKISNLLIAARVELFILYQFPFMP